MRKQTRRDELENIDNKNNGLCLSRRDFILAGSGMAVVAALPMGCGGDEAKPDGDKADTKAAGTPWESTKKAVCLMSSLHLADIYHHGEFIDCGTAARYKYSLGGWMSGLDNDTSMNGRSYTWATKSPSRIYFSTEEAAPMTFVIRAKKGGTDSFSVYLNDNPLSRVSFKGSDWEEHKVTAPAEAVVAGENYLKFIFKTSESKVGGLPDSFAVDYVRIIRERDNAALGTEFDPPHLHSIRQRFKTAETERESLILSLPTTLSYYVDVPKRGNLCMSVAPVPPGGQEKNANLNLRVDIRPVDGSAPTQALSKKFTGNTWHDEMVDLSPASGRLARIDITATGTKGARVVLGDPAIRIPPPKIEVSNKKVKNAVVVLIDTLRADRLTAYAKTRVKTPAFDKFVKESTLFERCQAPSNWTKPSCATVLTGLYPDSHKARGHESRLGSSIKMASEIFQESGFATGAFIANGYLATEFGFNRGWNEYVNFIRENKVTEAKNVFETSLDFISKNKDKPFYTYIQTIDPHVPYDPPDSDLKLYDAQGYDGPVQNRSTGNLLVDIKRKKITLDARDKRRLEALYDGEITYHDRYFGHFLDGLNKLGVLDDTAIIVCADHGEEFFDHGSVGHGHTMYQELLHVPLVIRAPGIVPAGKRLQNEVGLTDILPTLLEATKVPMPKQMEGRNLLPACNGAPPSPFEAAFASFFSEEDDRNLSWTVRKDDFKLYMRGPARTYLYNLKDDPREKSDVDTKYPLALRALRIALGQFIGAPDKGQWTSDQLAAQAVTAPDAKQEQADMPEDLKQQLRALGYIQ